MNDQVPWRNFLSFQFLPPVAQSACYVKWRLTCRKLSLCSGIRNQIYDWKISQQVWRKPLPKIPLFKWRQLFSQVSCLCKEKSPSIRTVTGAKMNKDRQASVCIPRKSTRQAAQQLRMPQSTVYTILRTSFNFKTYKYQFNNPRQRRD
jgi:hypothetical protein